MKAMWLALAAAALALPALGEPGATLRMEYSNPGLAPSSWLLVIRADGSGHFHAERGDAPTSTPNLIEPKTVDRDIRLNADFAGRVFETVRRHNLLRDGRCESHLKVAFQGWKKLSYSGPDGNGGCEFNYSKNKEIQELGESLVAVASTVVEGARVELLLLHDPLGLDHEMEFIQDGVRDGRLQQMCAIRDILERLAGDSAVMERVRRRAEMLLSESAK
jgi:hypothetical protein